MKKEYEVPKMTVTTMEVVVICDNTLNYAETNVRNDIDEDGKEEINWDQQWQFPLFSFFPFLIPAISHCACLLDSSKMDCKMTNITLMIIKL